MVSRTVQTLLGVLGFSFATVGIAEGSHHFTPEDAERLERLGGLALSPEGSMLAFERSKGIEVWSLGRSPRLVVHLPGSSPAWSPDSRTIAYYCEEAGHRQLCVWKRSGGASVPITHFADGISRAAYYWGPTAEFSWSPDSKSIAFVSRQCTTQRVPEDPNAPTVVGNGSLFLEVYEKLYRYESDLRQPDPNGPSFTAIAMNRACGVSRLFTIRADGTEERQVPLPHGQAFGPSWSPKGDQIAVIFDKDEYLDPAQPEHTTIAWVHLPDLTFRLMPCDCEIIKLMRWSLDGQTLAVVGQGDYSRWGDFGRLALFDVGTGRWTEVPQLSEQSLEDLRWITSSMLLARVDDRFSDSLVSLDLRTGKARRRPLDTLTLNEFDVSREGLIALSAGTGAFPPRLFLWQVDSEFQPHEILNPNPQLSAVQLGRQSRMTWAGGDGQPHDGIYIVPPDYQPGRRYPLLVDVYPEEARDGFHSGATGLDLGQLQASWGYAVLMAYPRGSVSRLYDFSRGKEAAAVASGVAGKRISVEDVLGGIKALADRGIGDAQRVCMFGHSNGGYVANVLATEAPESARCVVVAEGYSNMVDVYLNEPSHVWSQGFAQADLESSPETYVALSPVFKLSAVKAPMLLIDGDADWPSLLPEMIEEYNQLRLLNKKVEFVRYPAEGHVFSQPEHIHDKLARIHAFFDSALSAPSH